MFAAFRLSSFGFVILRSLWLSVMRNFRFLQQISDAANNIEKVEIRWLTGLSSCGTILKKVFSEITSACGAASSINVFFLPTSIEPLWIEGTEIAFVWVWLSGIYGVLQTAFVTWFRPHSRIASIVIHSFHILIISDCLMLRPVLSSKEFRQPYAFLLVFLRISCLELMMYECRLLTETEHSYAPWSVPAHQSLFHISRISRVA